MVPPNIEGAITSIVQKGEYKIEDVIATIK